MLRIVFYQLSYTSNTAKWSFTELPIAQQNYTVDSSISIFQCASWKTARALCYWEEHLSLDGSRDMVGHPVGTWSFVLVSTLIVIRSTASASSKTITIGTPASSIGW